MTATDAAPPENPAANLMNLIVMLLTPMFLWSTAGDTRLAYAAAAQTINAYGATNRLSLITVAKIIAFDIATLSSLSQSMHEDVSIVLALRLRSNANSLDKSSERHRRALEDSRYTEPAGEPEEPVEVLMARAQQMVQDARANIQASRQRAETRPAPAPAADTNNPPPAARVQEPAADRRPGEIPPPVPAELRAVNGWHPKGEVPATG
jgi:hypothetical protein